MWNLSISGRVGSISFKGSDIILFVSVGEQLVRKQENPLQEEHREGPGGGQHVRRQGRGRCNLARKLSRPDDVARLSVVFLQRGRLLRWILVSGLECSNAVQPNSFQSKLHNESKSLLKAKKNYVWLF